DTDTPAVDVTNSDWQTSTSLPGSPSARAAPGLIAAETRMTSARPRPAVRARTVMARFVVMVARAIRVTGGAGRGDGDVGVGRTVIQTRPGSPRRRSTPEP